MEAGKITGAGREKFPIIRPPKGTTPRDLERFPKLNKGIFDLREVGQCLKEFVDASSDGERDLESITIFLDIRQEAIDHLHLIIRSLDTLYTDDRHQDDVIRISSALGIGEDDVIKILDFKPVN